MIPFVLLSIKSRQCCTNNATTCVRTTKRQQQWLCLSHCPTKRRPPASFCGNSFSFLNPSLLCFEVHSSRCRCGSEISVGTNSIPIISNLKNRLFPLNGGSHLSKSHEITTSYIEFLFLSFGSNHLSIIQIRLLQHWLGTHPENIVARTAARRCCKR